MQFALQLPILGFESVTHMDLLKIDDIFMRLESIGEGPTFTLINPYALREYSFDIPTSLQAAMQIDEGTNLLIFNIVILSSSIEDSTINFVAPLIFNTDNQKMAQIIIDNRPDFALAEPIRNYLKGQSDE
jgi:flagellar assembly factor FliW